MRQALQSVGRVRQRVSTTRSAPAPVRGWNAKDSIAAMNAADAVILDNWWPSAADVELRKGSSAHVTGIQNDEAAAAEVETLAVYRNPSGTQVMFAFAGDESYNVTSAGTVGSAVHDNLTNARWQTANFGTSSGHFLICVNGADEMEVYDGSSWNTINGSSTPAITGVDTDDLIHVHVHKERVWYVEINSTSVWYSAAGAFAGALTELPLAGVFKKGGYVVAMGTWSLDGGNGPDDLAVFISSEGEAAVYAGTDPASSSTWAKVGTYVVGKPIGRRCFEQLGGELLIITTEGVLPASRAFTTAQSDSTVAITYDIQTAMSQAVERYSSTFGWELSFFPGGPALLLNVPVASGQQQQFVMNTVTKRWARFRKLDANPGWPANCFAVFNGNLYFGTLGEVRRAWSGTADVGLAIVGEVLCAFNYFGNRNQQKHFKMVRPVIGWDSNPAEISLGVDVEFIAKNPASAITLPAAASTALVWDSGSWDVATWGGEVALRKNWYGIEGVGFAGALHMKVTTGAASVKLSSVDYLFEAGEVL